MVFRYIFSFLSITTALSACNSHVYNQRRYNPDAMKIELHPEKRSRQSLTYPQADFSSALIEFRKKIGRWPNSWMELGLQNNMASTMIDGMLQSHFDELEIEYTSNDSIIIYYEYITVPKSYKSNNFVLSKLYKGYYFFGQYGGDFIVENKKVKKRSNSYWEFKH